MRRLAAMAVLFLALGLFTVALLPRPRLHAVLSARAGHSVTAGYVENVHARAAVCSGIALVIAVVTWIGVPLQAGAGGSWPLPDGVSATLIAIGVFLRALLMAGPPHYDETFTVTEFASHSPLFFLTRYTHANNHVLHTLLVWGVRLVSGNRLWALRLPAFAAGVGVLFATWALARRWHGTAAARAAVALAAVATPLVEYSAQARGYTILTLVFLLLLLAEDDRLRTLLIAAGAWTIPTMLYAAAAWAIWVALTQRTWRRLACIALAAGALTFLLYLPILVISGLASVTSNGNTLSVPYPVLFQELPRTLADMAGDWSLSFTIPVAIGLGAAALVAIARRTTGGIAIGAALLAILPLLLLLRKVPYPRIWIFLLPLVLIAAGETCTRFVRIPAPLLIAATLVFAANALRVTGRESFVEDPAMRDVPAVAGVVRGFPPDARVLVTSPLDAPYAFYIPGPRIVQDRFDSDPAAVRAAMIDASRRFAIVSTRPDGDAMLRALALPFNPVPIARFPHSTLLELRSGP